MNYFNKLKNIVSKNNSALVIGLDTDLNKLPSFFLKYKNPAAEFNRQIIESTKNIAAGYKLNMAFYEFLGADGIEAVSETLNAIPSGMIKICDAKRGDIDNTAEMYAATYFDKFDFDSITLSPYLGTDSLTPFLKRENKLVYVLALTSNHSFSDFQKLKTGERYLYEEVISKCLSLSKNNNVGFVFGANHTSEILEFTSLHSYVPVLIPGIGAQENDLVSLMNSVRSDVCLINSSRAVIYTAGKECNANEFNEKIKTAAESLNYEINKLRKPSAED